MCLDCGCEEGNEKKYFEHKHDHAHPHVHTHDGHTHSHAASEEQHPNSRVINLELSVLAKNNAIADKNRDWLKSKGIVTVNIISSPGSGKTTLLEKTLEKLEGKINCSVIVGDQSTDNDAQRLMKKCKHVYQIETNSSCHINAEQVGNVLEEVTDDTTQLLFIENVGNLICPAAFDLGEDFKVAVLSTTEGEDKPVKYPVVFSDARIVVLTKVDLIPYLDWELKKCRQAIQQVNPGVYTFELSSKSGEGMQDWIEYLGKLVN